MKSEPIEIRTKLRGVTHDDLASGVNRQEIIHKLMRPGQRLELRPEPDNAVDPGAVGVWLRKRVLLATAEYHVGYLSHELARDVRVLIAQGRRVTCTVLDITGGSTGKVARGVNVVIRA